MQVTALLEYIDRLKILNALLHMYVCCRLPDIPLENIVPCIVQPYNHIDSFVLQLYLFQYAYSLCK